MKFSINDQHHQLSPVDPDLTLLDYLRDRLHLTGTKEGCASGDCGACSVVLISRQADGSPHYQAINACITLLAQLQGKAVVTVEYLSRSGQLHPVQQALADNHGSQCGFCTPGFIMSLYALYQQNRQPDREQVLDALSGNLCRCTGYRPIVESVQHWTPTAAIAPLPLAADQAPAAQADCFWPSTENELQQILQTHPNARMIAGGTDITLEVTQQMKSLKPLVILNGIHSLQQTELTASHLTLGAGVTYTQAEPLLHQHFPAFHALMERLASRQIRNLGTLGGNICNASPIGDTPPVLLALDAELTLASAAGTRRLPIREFFLGYKQTALQSGEYLQAIHLPLLARNQQLQVYKISKRKEDDISAVLAGFWLESEGNTITGIRLGFGGMAATPARASQTEQALLGQPLTLASFEQAAPLLVQDFSPLTDVRATAAYRLQVAQNLLIKWGLELTGALQTGLEVHHA